MMIHNNFHLLRKFTTTLSTMFAATLFIFGCGGGGGGKQPLITPENKIPAASISSPTGTQFNEGDNIAFGGSATDEEDGELTGASLVWTSNIDGTIGTGTAVTTSELTAGDHEITLKATDSEGGVHTTAPTLINIQQTRFIKMGTQTTPAVSDASNAFDGDHATAATIMTPDTEFIHFKAKLGDENTFIFKIMLAASTPGSRIAIQGLDAGDPSWRPIEDIGLDDDKTATVMVSNPQSYKNTDGYINLRARWEGGGSEDQVGIFEIWRIDPIFAGPKTSSTGVTDMKKAFDGDQASGATVSIPWDGSAPYLHFKAFVGTEGPNTFTFNLSHNSIGSDQSIYIDVENFATPAPDDWTNLKDYKLDTTNPHTITVTNAQTYLDEKGYISLRARWIGYASGTQMKIYEISRLDPIFIGPKTELGWNPNTANSVDGNLDTFATLFYHWGEADRYDFLHVLTYLGDRSNLTFSIKSGASTSSPGSELVLEGENEPDNWQVIKRISLDITRTTLIELLNGRPYVNSDGFLSLRLRWENITPQFDYDIHLYEIWN